MYIYNLLKFIVFIIINRPPSSSIRSSLNDLSTILESMSSYDTIIIGDFNIQVNTDNHASLSLKKLIFEHSLTQHIHFPTISNGNIIDLVLSPSDSNLISSPTQSTLISDHFAILFVLQLSVVHNTRSLRYFRNISSINQSLFVNSVFDHMNSITSPLSNPDSLFDAFNAALSNSLYFYAPSTTLTHCNHPKSPLFNTKLTNMRESLRRLQSIYASSKMNSDLCSFKVCHSLYSKKLLSTKSSYFTDLLCKYGTSSKQAYPSLVGKSKPRHLPNQPDTVLCSSFANFFQNKVSNIIAALPNVNVDLLTLNSSSLVSHNHWSCFTLPTRLYVLSLMASLKSNSSLDRIPLTLLGTLSPSLIEHITMIIHASLITSILPKSMKHSYITPIIKKTTLSHSNLSSYRPITQLSSISKTLERIVSAQLIHYITTNSIIDKFQSAYLPYCSTESYS